jgi:hypothetical protein
MPIQRRRATALSQKEVTVAEPAPQRSLKRVWIWALVLIVVIWAIYALTGGPDTPYGDNPANPVEETRQ